MKNCFFAFRLRHTQFMLPCREETEHLKLILLDGGGTSLKRYYDDDSPSKDDRDNGSGSKKKQGGRRIQIESRRVISSALEPYDFIRIHGWKRRDPDPAPFCVFWFDFIFIKGQVTINIFKDVYIDSFLEIDIHRKGIFSDILFCYLFFIS